MSTQGGLPSKTPKTVAPVGMGRKVMVCESLLSAAAVCAFEGFMNKQQKTVATTIKVSFLMTIFFIFNLAYLLSILFNV